MADRAAALAELERREKAGMLSNKQVAAFSELRKRGVIGGAQQSTSDYMGKVLESGGVSAEDRQRLMNTGVTPGTAAEYAAAHIQSNRAKGREVNEGEQKAIFDLYKKQAGRTDTSNQDFYQQQRDFELASRRETLGGRVVDASAGLSGSLAGKGLDALGLVAPQTANKLRENVDDIYGVDPDSIAGKAGNVAAEALFLPVAASTGPLGMAAIYGGMGAGGQRREIDDLRSRGQEISGWEATKSAGAVGLVEGISGFVGGVIFGKMAKILGPAAVPATSEAIVGAKETIKKLLKEAVKLAGGSLAEGTEEGVTQLITNGIRQGLNPNVALSDGIKEAFAMGMILAPFGAAGAHAGGHTETDSNTNIKNQINNPGETKQLQSVLPAAPATHRLPDEVGVAEQRVKEAQQGVDQAMQDISTPVEGTQGTIEVSPPDAVAPKATENFNTAQTPLGDMGTDGEYTSAEITEYIGTMEGDSAGLIGTMIGDGPFVVANVPVGDINENNLVGDEVDPGKTEDANDFLAAGSPAPPIVTAQVGGKLIIADGTHRLRAAKKAGQTTIAAVVSKSYADENNLSNTASVPSPDVQAGALPASTATTQQQRNKLKEASEKPVTAPPRGDPDAGVALAPGQTTQFTSEGDMATPASERRKGDGSRPGKEKRKADRRVTPQQERDEITRLMREGNEEEANKRIAALQEAARRDSKGTGLLAGTEFDNQIESAQEEVDRTGDSRQVMVMDVGNLGIANAVQGHQEADSQLKRIADAVMKIAGPDASFRTGGDEISLILPPGTSRLQAGKMLKQIEQEVGFAEIVPGTSMFITGAVGTLTKGKKSASVLTAADKQGEIRKRKIKKDRNEPGITKEEAVQIATSPQQGDPFSNQNVRKAAQNLKKKRTELQAARDRKATSIRKGRQSAQRATSLGGTDHKSKVPQTVEDWITPLSSRILDISPYIFNRLMTMESLTNMAREKLKKALHTPAGRMKRHIKKSGKEREFKRFVLNGRFGAARSLFGNDAQLLEDFDGFVSTHKNLLANQRDAGITIGELNNYWPRFIKDYRSFKAVFGNDMSVFETAWDLARQVKGRHTLTESEKAEIANSVIQGYGPKKPGSMGIPNARKRSIEEISDEQLDYYVDPFEATFRYIDGSTYAAERSRFLGKNHTPENMSETIGAMVQQEVDEGRLNRDQQDNLYDLLNTRFTADSLSTSKAVRNFKQLTYLITLGQFRSAVTQMTDMAFTAAEHGILNTGKGMLAALNITPAERRFAMEDIGIHDYGEEFKDVGRLAKTTDWVLRKAGFKLLDRLGKESRINAAWNNFSNAAANLTSKAYQKLERDYKHVLGDVEFDQTMSDLRQGNKTEAVKYLLFLDITKVQPLTTSQMPVKYLQMPNGRVVYTLKTFTIMQLDHIRRDMVRKIATPGERKEGLAHLARYMLYFTLIGMGADAIKDWLKGRTVSPEEIPDRAIEAMLGAVGLNRYVLEQAKSDPVDAAVNFLMPPLSFISGAWSDVVSDKPGVRSVRNVPLAGEMLYHWFFFGRGYHLNREQAKTEYRAKLRDIRDEASKALSDGDTAGARRLLDIYNYQRKQGVGDGRKRPLNMQNLRGDVKRDIVRDEKEAAKGNWIERKTGSRVEY